MKNWHLQEWTWKFNANAIMTYLSSHRVATWLLINGTIQEANRAAANLLKVSQRFLWQTIFFVIEEERQVFHAKLSELQQAQQEEWVVRLVPRKVSLKRL